MPVALGRLRQEGGRSHSDSLGAALVRLGAKILITTNEIFVLLHRILQVGVAAASFVVLMVRFRQP